MDTYDRECKTALSQTIFQGRREPLDAFFAPATVAVIGATDRRGSVGRTLLWNLISNPFGGTVFPVNPHRSSVLGIKAYRSIAEVPAEVELAVIVTPAPTVPAIVGECNDAGVKAILIISAGFGESGLAGVQLEARVREQLARGRMRAIGPNCLGLISPLTGLNATFAASMVRPGSIALISQSGALLTAILDWSLQEGIGFSAFVSIGSMLDVAWGDVIDYLADDPHTKSILIYMESIGNAKGFMSAAREASLRKPIIVIKAGRSPAAAKAAASHTGALTGSDDVLDAAFRRCGVLRVHSLEELFGMAELLAVQPIPKGPRLAMLTNAGGPGVLATDALVASGGQLSSLCPETIQALDRVLPAHWSRGNPIDILGDAPPERYVQAAEIALKDPNCDGLLTILTPQAMTDPTQTAERLKSLAETANKPLLASWMGGSSVAAGRGILANAGFASFSYPDTAARAFEYMWQYSENLRGLYETPVSLATLDKHAPDREEAASIIDAARRSGRALLSEIESKQVLAAYGIPVVETRPAVTEGEAVEVAARIGYPVVLKVLSASITHKTDVGGVQLNLADEAAVRSGYRSIESSVRQHVGEDHFGGVTVQPMIRRSGCELILGSSVDPQFGPVLLFGAGGQMVDILEDRALGFPPLNQTLARRMIERTRVLRALKGYRGAPPMDLAALERVVVNFAQLVLDQPWIKEIDINPLLASVEQIIGLDARVILQSPDANLDQLANPVIRPYPAQYVGQWTTKNGTKLTIRPIRPEDEPLMVQFHEVLSEQTVYYRYFQMLQLSQRIAHERLSRLCFIDYDREIALIAEAQNPQRGTAEIVGIGRLTKTHAQPEAEFALVVSDRFHRQGLGTELMRKLLQFARDERLKRVNGTILAENVPMLSICKKLGFRLSCPATDNEIRATIDL